MDHNHLGKPGQKRVVQVFIQKQLRIIHGLPVQVDGQPNAALRKGNAGSALVLFLGRLPGRLQVGNMDIDLHDARLHPHLALGIGQSDHRAFRVHTHDMHAVPQSQFGRVQLRALPPGLLQCGRQHFLPGIQRPPDLFSLPRPAGFVHLFKFLCGLDHFFGFVFRLGHDLQRLFARVLEYLIVLFFLRALALRRLFADPRSLVHHRLRAVKLALCLLPCVFGAGQQVVHGGVFAG
ncbi:hypothetical protein SDC9_172443 [bioreactor metagenome]|uniref:Uncharacterized protein n=1 Tax=bioreactor metagenome TaxID=1076179 RepID=A0A645GFU6_9ZZZZ